MREYLADGFELMETIGFYVMLFVLAAVCLG